MSFTFLYNINECDFLDKATDLNREVFRYCGAVKPTVDRNKVSQTLIFTWMLKFYHWQWILLSFFPSRNRIALFAVKKHLPNDQVWVIILSSVLSSYDNVVPWNGRANLGCNSNNYPGLFLKTITIQAGVFHSTEH